MNVDLVPFVRGVCVLCKPRLIFSRINGPVVIHKTVQDCTKILMTVSEGG